MIDYDFKIDFAPNKNDWNTFLKSNNLGYSFTIEWSEVVEESYKFKSVNIAVLNKSKIIAILPVVILNKSKIYSRAFAPYGTVIISKEFEFNRLEISSKIFNSLNEIGYNELITRGFSKTLSVEKDVSMIMSLKNLKLPFIDNLPSKRKNLIRNSYNRSKLDLRIDHSCLNDFYELYLANMSKLGTPVHSFLFFQKILKIYDKNCILMMLYENSIAVSSVILIIINNQCVVPFAASDPKYNDKLVNIRIYNEAIEYAITNNCTTFDFGRSLINSGTYNFKKQFGATPYFLEINRINLKNGEINKIDNFYRSKFAKIISSIWKIIPVTINRKVGPFLRRRLP